MAGKLKDYTGTGRERLTAVRFSHQHLGKAFWLFSCSCGGEITVRPDQVLSGNTRSCGCLQAANGLARRRDFRGQKFNRLTVKEEVEKPKRGRWWRCECECGNECVVPQRNLISRGGKATKSCGCLQREAAAKQAVAMGAGNATHGMTDSPEWLAWKNMRDRCDNPDCDSYPRYGGRGIKVCERWRDFQNFIADMGARPSDKHSLDRHPNQNGDYEPANCRWATMTEQCRNKTNNLLLTVNGVTKTAAEWADERQMPRQVLYGRINRDWPHDLAVLTPPGVIPPDLPSHIRTRRRNGYPDTDIA